MNNNQKIIFCFTYAGGVASFFNKLEICLSPELKLVKLEYSGHGSRHKEDFYNSFEELAEDLYKSLKCVLCQTDNPKTYTSYSLLGYSMGSIAVVEMLKKISAEKEFGLPEHIFLAAHEPFTKAELLEYNPEESDAYVKERTLKFGGIPTALAHNNIFWRMYLPIYRADYTLIAKYRFEELDMRCKIPATIFYSETDTRYTDMQKWTSYFVGSCKFVRYEGSHFFINEHYKDMANVIRRSLLA